MIKAILIGLLLLVLVCGLAILMLAPSRTPAGLLNGADRLTGGGIGVERAGEGVTFGDHGQTLDIWRPSARSAKPRPVIIFFYGGAWRTGSRTVYGFVGRAMAHLGYVVVIPDYRKAPKSGFPAFMEDAADALAWTHRHIAAHGGDPARIGLVGHSAGAHMALLLALDERWTKRDGLAPDVVKAVVGISGPYDFYPFEDDDTREVFGRSLPEDNQPIHFARADAPSILLIASNADTRVRSRNSVAMEARLQEAGAHAQLALLPGLSHEMTLLAFMPQLGWKSTLRAQIADYLVRTLPIS